MRPVRRAAARRAVEQLNAVREPGSAKLKLRHVWPAVRLPGHQKPGGRSARRLETMLAHKDDPTLPPWYWGHSSGRQKARGMNGRRL